MKPIAAAYNGVRTRVGELTGTLDETTSGTPVPPCPRWTVHDVVAHLVGVVEDAMAGRLDGVATDPWTQAQVDARRRAFHSGDAGLVVGGGTALRRHVGRDRPRRSTGGARCRHPRARHPNGVGRARGASIRRGDHRLRVRSPSVPRGGRGSWGSHPVGRGRCAGLRAVSTRSGSRDRPSISCVPSPAVAASNRSVPWPGAVSVNLFSSLHLGSVPTVCRRHRRVIAPDFGG